MNENQYFSNAKLWYIRSYAYPTRERFIYFLLFTLSCLNIFLLLDTFKVAKVFKFKKQSIVAYLNRESHLIPLIIKIRSFYIEEDISYYLLKKFIFIKESLVYEDSNNALNEKFSKLESFISSDLKNEFEKEFYKKEDGSDIDFILRGGQKFVDIKKILFPYEKKNIIYKWFYDLLNISNLNHNATIYFTIEDDITEKEQYFVAEIEYDIYIPFDKEKKNQPIDFKILSYEKKEITKEEFIYEQKA